MKRNIYYGLLAAEAIICIMLTLAQASFAWAFSAVAAFPFEQIGFMLRFLSLSGGPGNAAAMAIYTAVGVTPVVVLLMLRKRRKIFPEDGLLGLFSIALFVILYFMVNPKLMPIPTAGLAVGKAMLGGIGYSLLCGYFILRALRLFFQSDAKRLAQYLSMMLGVLGVLFVYLIGGVCLNGLLDAVTNVRTGHTAGEQNFGTSYLLLGLQFTVDVLPYAFNIGVIIAARRLLDALRADRYADETVAAAARMSRYCGVALVAMVLTNIGFNLLQWLFVGRAVNVNVTVRIPVFSMAFVLAALLLTRFVTENKQLKDENDAFI